MKPALNRSLTFCSDSSHMRTGALLSFPVPELDYDPEAEALALSEQTARMVAVAQALVMSQRHVDMSGLQNQVGLLCAKALDLPASKTGFLKLELRRLASGLGALDASMRENSYASHGLPPGTGDK